MKLSIDDIVKGLGVKPKGRSVASFDVAGFAGVSTDSRSVNKDDLFFAIKGEKYDGHDFVGQAIAGGAAGVVVGNDFKSDKAAVFPVGNTLQALGDLASFVRDKYDIKCVAITGSNGKTTTKEMLAACLESKFSTFKSPGNYNNLIGLPLSMFHLDNSHEAAVFELGMNARGEICRLAEICKPQIGAFTNIAPVHLEFLGTIDAVAKAKYELIERLPDDGVVVLNADDEFLSDWIKSLKQDVITYGVMRDADFKVSDYEIMPEGKSAFTIDNVQFEINFPGVYNIYNAVCAVATSSAFGLEISKLPDVLKTVKPYSLRSEIIDLRNIVIINDCYNANPASMKKAIDVLADYPAMGRRIAVLGDMLELGHKAIEYHRELGEYLNSKRIDSLFATGDLGHHFMDKFNGEFKKHFAAKDDLADELRGYLKPGDVVLIKGSRGIELEKVTEKLLENN